ncbi:hypothetical protein GDO86_008972 [Hymenochirus boettgeri]|uniref:Uncharacterized protein n=1 Tax=Hymenochirus boettgeri TaxID=247094 RepID=A0A8T2JJC2_9PIPI|nr:hypothetical protein GDO86_008972 [Hymenochirus boettgeri]
MPCNYFAGFLRVFSFLAGFIRQESDFSFCIVCADDRLQFLFCVNKEYFLAGSVRMLVCRYPFNIKKILLHTSLFIHLIFFSFVS